MPFFNRNQEVGSMSNPGASPAPNSKAATGIFFIFQGSGTPILVSLLPFLPFPEVCCLQPGSSALVPAWPSSCPRRGVHGCLEHSLLSTARGEGSALCRLTGWQRQSEVNAAEQSAAWQGTSFGPQSLQVPQALRCDTVVVPRWSEQL